MPRPTDKDGLMKTAEEQFGKLRKMIDSIPNEVRNAPFDLSGIDKKEAHWKRDKNLRDVLTHLHEWHLMVIRWYDEGTVKGGMPAVPGEGYTWQTLPNLNQKIWERYQNVTLADAEEMLRKSHADILELVKRHTDEELFTKGLYKWTKTSSLGAYFISCTSSHYEWAMMKIKTIMKMRKA